MATSLVFHSRQDPLPPQSHAHPLDFNYSIPLAVTDAGVPCASDLAQPVGPAEYEAHSVCRIKVK
jgi:hypothetical protein